MAVFAADPDLEGVVAAFVLKPFQALDFIRRSDIAPHAGRVNPKRPWCAAEQLANRLAFALAIKIPERRIDAANRPPEIGAGKFVLLLRNDIDQPVQIERIPSERIRCHLPMQHEGGNIGIIGRDLPPSLAAVFGGYLYETNKLRAEGLDLRDFHPWFPMRLDQKRKLAARRRLNDDSS